MVKARGPAAPTRADCPICGSRDLLYSVAFEAWPLLCSVLYCDEASARAAENGQFVLTFCRNCGHLFNAAFDESRVNYTQSYDSSLHYSPRFVAFAQALAERLSKTYALAGKSVVDIGCGKGDFLKLLCATSGAEGVGFDKSFEEERGGAVPSVRFVDDWFNDSYANIRPDFVSCRHVIEHVAEPVAFLRALRNHPSIEAETVFYFECPNVLYTLRDLGIWDLIYQHVSFFTPASLRAAFEAAGFEVLNEGTSFGEQYLYLEARAGSESRREAPSQPGTVEPLVRNFERLFHEKTKLWRDYFDARDPSNAVVWGAGAKGVMFVNLVDRGNEIGALVDVSPYKQGRFAPGTGTPVIAPEDLRGRPVQSIIVMNPLYRNEIAERVAALSLTPEIVVA